MSRLLYTQARQEGPEGVCPFTDPPSHGHDRMLSILGVSPGGTRIDGVVGQSLGDLATGVWRAGQTGDLEDWANWRSGGWATGAGRAGQLGKIPSIHVQSLDMLPGMISESGEACRTCSRDLSFRSLTLEDRPNGPAP
jgi:hypothetical protein